MKNILIGLITSKERVRLFYGYPGTGEAWAEENDIIGRVSNSTGLNKIPLLIHNSRSMGGGGILDGQIVAIYTTKGRQLYAHNNFNTGSWVSKVSDTVGYSTDVYHNGKLHARFKTIKQGNRYVQFMNAKRFSK